MIIPRWLVDSECNRKIVFSFCKPIIKLIDRGSRIVPCNHLLKCSMTKMILKDFKYLQSWEKSNCYTDARNDCIMSTLIQSADSETI